jgi:hypothetical protein
MKRFFAVLIICVVHSILSSCNIAAVAAYITSPDPEQEALFELPNVPTVVFVDDRRNEMHPTRLRRVIADRVTEELLSRELLTTMISPRDAMRVSATNDKYNEPLPVNELGKAVDASVVIYIEMTAFGLTSDGQTADPRASCNIRVIDVENRERLFPLDAASLTVVEKLKHIGPNRVTSSSEARELAEELALKLADSISKVFYTHTTGRLGDNLNRK